MHQLDPIGSALWGESSVGRGFLPTRAWGGVGLGHLQGAGAPAQSREQWAASEVALTCDRMVTYTAAMDEVFRALAAPTRRSLLDELFKEDGQTLSALGARLPMTRFGVMKHL